MATVYKIPLSNVPQRFEISIDGQALIFIVRWFSGMSCWVLSILDAETEAVLINDMPLVLGADLLSQFRYVGINGSLVVVRSEGDATATITELGDSVNLYYATA